ncbi:MAG: endonuclease domain-containing protein [Oscillospiraceae bacterium]|nr:endonuclease domain-containing protein [Oscillospiraceae bacterium]
MKNTWYSKNLKPYAQQLRKDMTKEERKLWYDFLKTFPFIVKRQKIIGGYIADFYIPSCKTVIELDGSQHYTDEGKEYDLERNNYMISAGITVLRYSNADINQNFSGVCEDIRQKCLPHMGKSQNRS